jgi:hypothetical protein
MIFEGVCLGLGFLVGALVFATKMNAGRFFETINRLTHQKS